MPSSIATSSSASAGSPIATTHWAGPARLTSSTTSRPVIASDSDIAVERSRRSIEAAEHDAFVLGVRRDLAHRDLRCGYLGIAVDAGRNSREGDARKAVLPGQRQAVAI